MTRFAGLLLALTLAVVAGCADPQDASQNSKSQADELVADDRAVLEVVIGDFAVWKEATFGDLEGVLALDPLSASLIYQTLPDTRQLIAPITDVVSDELIMAFLERNTVQTDVTSVVASSPWARIYTPADESESYPQIPPDGAKAFGSISLPGFDPSRTRALVQINHSWSIHGAVVTYVLSKRDGIWTIQARDQEVFL